MDHIDVRQPKTQGILVSWSPRGTCGTPRTGSSLARSQLATTPHHAPFSPENQTPASKEPIRACTGVTLPVNQDAAGCAGGNADPDKMWAPHVAWAYYSTKPQPEPLWIHSQDRSGVIVRLK